MNLTDGLIGQAMHEAGFDKSDGKDGVTPAKMVRVVCNKFLCDQILVLELKKYLWTARTVFVAYEDSRAPWPN